MNEAPEGSWAGTVVYCAGTAWDGNRGTDQHLANELSRRVPVLYVDPPSSVLDRGALHPDSRGSRPQTVHPRLARLTPRVLPGRTRWPVRATTGWIIRRQLARAVRALGADVAVVVAANLWPVFGACGERRKVLFATDDWPAGAALMGLSEAWVRHRERSLLAAADAVVTVSEPLAAAIQLRGGPDAVVVENGVDASAFARVDDARLPDDVAIGVPAAGLVGHISERIDLRFLEATVATGCPVLLVGPRPPRFDDRRLRELVARPNVQWVGAKPFDELPSYLRVMGVGLLPYRDTPFNRASFPLKVLEYLAAGRPVVSTDLPAVRRLGPEVRIGRDPDEFASEVVRALAEPAESNAVAARRAIAAARAWPVVADRFAAAIGAS